MVCASESTIKLESSSGSSVGGAAAIAAYYYNGYPLTTSSPGLVTAASSADRNSSMLVSGTYSECTHSVVSLQWNKSPDIHILLSLFFSFFASVDPRTMHLSTTGLTLIVLSLNRTIRQLIELIFYWIDAVYRFAAVTWYKIRVMFVSIGWYRCDK